MYIIHFIVIEFNKHYNKNKMFKGFENNDSDLDLSNAAFKHCIFSIFKLSIFLFLLPIFLFLHFRISAFLHFPFSVVEDLLTKIWRFLQFYNIFSPSQALTNLSEVDLKSHDIYTNSIVWINAILKRQIYVHVFFLHKNQLFFNW